MLTDDLFGQATENQRKADVAFFGTEESISQY